MNASLPKSEPPTPEADRLVRLVLAGETQAFAELIRLYEADLWRIAATLLRDWATTENLVQQAFIDAYTNLHRYELGTDFGAWIRTLTRNRLRKEVRTWSRAEQRLAEYREQLLGRLRSEEPVHDDADAYLAALRGCRDQLPAEESALLNLRYESGWTFDKIAAKQGTTPAAIQRAISRIRFRLRACIEGQMKRT